MVAVTLAAMISSAACHRGDPPAANGEPELPTLDVTHWTEATELFMEHPPLVAGETVRFAVHLTRLSDFSAMTQGRPRIEMAPASGGNVVTLPGNEPSRPGVFRVEGPLPPAGEYRWALVIEAPGLSDRHDLGRTRVFADRATAIADAGQRAEDDPTAISYLKEPQWTNGFATVQVRDAELRRGLRAAAVIEPLTGGDAVVAAPAAGRFVTGSLPRIGTRVTAGEELGRLQPRSGQGTDRATLDAAIIEAEAGVEAGRVELARAERLLAERAVPARRVDEARRALAVADARLSAARARLEQREDALRTGGGAAANSYAIRTPISGVVAEVYAALGASFEEGAPLFRIVRTDRVELQAHVPAADLPLGAVNEIAIEVPGRPTPVVVEADHMHHAGILDAKTHALPVQFDVSNRAGQLLIGQTVTAILYTPERQRMTAVPQEAVLTEAGRTYVFVQLGGESFARRYIEIGPREGGLVGVRSGLTPGDRVVTRGAYDVQLASAASGLPAEGHVH